MDDNDEEHHSPNPYILGPSSSNDNPRPVTFTPGSQAWAQPYRLPTFQNKSIKKHGFEKQELLPSTSPQGDKQFLFHCSCGKRYTQRSSLRKHISTEKNWKVFKCIHCQRRFNYHKSLIDHINKRHQNDFGDGAASVGGGVNVGDGFWCHTCGTLFKTIEDHRLHRKNWHARNKLEKPKIGLPPSPKQPAITRFLMRPAIN